MQTRERKKDRTGLLHSLYFAQVFKINVQWPHTASSRVADDHGAGVSRNGVSQRDISVTSVEARGVTQGPGL